MVLPREIELAAHNGDNGTVRQFLESNPERVNEDVNEDGYFNLMHCAISSCEKTSYADSAQLVRYLISQGADVECRSNYMSPLECACSCSHPEAVAILLRAGANVNRIDELGTAVCLPLFTISGLEPRIFECLCHLLRGGLALDVLRDGTTTPLEQIIDERIQLVNDAGLTPGHLGRSLDLARAVRASMYTSASPRLSPWRQYVLAPSVAVLRLRSLVARGRARERGVVSGPTPRPIAWLLAPRTPPEIVWNVLAFWNPRHE